MSDTIEAKRAQVANQCRVVRHLAEALARVHDDKAVTFDSGHGDDALLELVGNWTASRMEILGDMLNGMDAVDEKDDAWTYPIFDEAQRRWPQKDSSVLLWCCHVRGPDDVHAAPDYETALAWSDRFNDWVRAHGIRDENDPIMRAAPAIYPWSADAHAAALTTTVAQFADGKLP